MSEKSISTAKKGYPEISKIAKFCLRNVGKYGKPSLAEFVKFIFHTEKLAYYDFSAKCGKLVCRSISEPSSDMKN